MSRPANYVRPIQLSLQVLRDAGIDSFPISLKKILRHYDIRLMCYEDYCKCNDCDMQVCFDLFGKDGATIENEGKFLIVYNRNATPKDRIRFTLAHELGHIFHRHHRELGVTTLQRLWVEKSLYDVMEDEANCFARNLLCPAISVQLVLRSHGFVATDYDASQKRNVWWKVPNAKCLPNLPLGLTDSFLVRQSFMVTDAAAKTRCHFLREDLRNTSMAMATDILNRFRYSAQWRCRKCGAIRQQESVYCYHCGSKNRFSLLPMDSPSRQPVYIRYHGQHYASCPVCGNAEIPSDSAYCPICGSLICNPCVPGRIRNHRIEHLLDLAEQGSLHLNPPGVRYCLTCGAPTVYGEATALDLIETPDTPEDRSSSGIRLSLYYYLLSRGFEVETDNQGGLPTVKYGPNIPCYNPSQGEYRVQKCPVCLNEDNDSDADYCIMCGTSLTNLCDGIESDYNGEVYRHSNPANARFCRCCGKPTAYSRLAILQPYRDALRTIAEKDALSRELAEMDIDEDLFWKMQDEEEADTSNTTSQARPGSIPDPSPVQSLSDDDDGELPF